MVAARELRMIKVEADALRRELNEWRDRSGLPRLEEPARNDGFNLVLSGEVEVIVSSQQEDDENMEDDGDDDLYNARSSEDVEQVARAVAINMSKPSQSPPSAPSPTGHQFAHNVPPLPVHQNGVTHTHSQQVPGPQPRASSPFFVKHANIGKIPIILREVQSVSHYELIRDFETYIRHIHRP